VVDEAFRLTESRGSWRHLESLVSGRGALPWQRVDDGTEPAGKDNDNKEDPGRLWQSPAHGAADARTPLMSALLATPRHGLLACFGGSEAGSPGALRQLLRRSGAQSLSGLSAAAALASGLVSGGE
ncbi:unnamed protein product, partial [Polarella glacialis]